jgi:predicted small secreted protein
MLKLRRTFLFLALAAAAIALAGCNTMRGMGKDIEAAGKTIQKSADKND